MKKYTVDAVSDGWVTLLLRPSEDVKLALPLDQLPGVREGDIISAEIKNEVVVEFRIEKAETAAAKEKIQQKLDRLKNRPRR